MGFVCFQQNEYEYRETIGRDTFFFTCGFWNSNPSGSPNASGRLQSQDDGLTNDKMAGRKEFMTEVPIGVNVTVGDMLIVVHRD